jgi:hypothetical protein
MKENTPEEDTYSNRQLYPSFIPALGDASDASQPFLIKEVILTLLHKDIKQPSEASVTSSLKRQSTTRRLANAKGVSPTK